MVPRPPDHSVLPGSNDGNGPAGVPGGGCPGLSALAGLLVVGFVCDLQGFMEVD